MQMPNLHSYFAASFKWLSWKLYKMQRHSPTICHVYEAKFLSKSRVCNSSNKIFIRVLWPLCTCPAYILTFLQVSNHYLENCWRSKYGNMKPTSPYVQASIFLSKSRVCNSSNKSLIKVLWPLCTFLFCCNFQIIILKTVGEVVETQT